MNPPKGLILFPQKYVCAFTVLIEIAMIITPRQIRVRTSFLFMGLFVKLFRIKCA